MDEQKADQAITEAVPGKVLANLLAGSGPGEMGYAVVVSELDGEYFVSFIEFYDPGAIEIPQPQYGIPPTPEGLAVTYRESYPSALEAGERYGFFTALLLEEGRLKEEGFQPGLAYLLNVVENHKGSVLAERAYEAGMDTETDPDYVAEIERQLEEQVPKESSREAMKSLAEFTYREESREDSDK